MDDDLRKETVPRTGCQLHIGDTAKGTQEMIRNSLVALAISVVLVVLTTGVEASAKVQDKIGQDPTAGYDSGRGAQLQDATAPPYISGIGFEISAEIKFNQKK